MRNRSLWSLLTLELRSRNARTPVHAFAGILELLVVVVAIAIAVRADRLEFYWRLFFGAGAVAVVCYEVWQMRRLYELALRGEEVEAKLVRVENEWTGDSDLWIATYLYEFGDREFEHREGGARRDTATRFGEKVTLLIDPVQPRNSLLLESRQDPGT